MEHRPGQRPGLPRRRGRGVPRRARPAPDRPAGGRRRSRRPDHDDDRRPGPGRPDGAATLMTPATPARGEALGRGLAADRLVLDPDVLAAMSHDEAEWAP